MHMLATGIHIIHTLHRNTYIGGTGFGFLIFSSVGLGRDKIDLGGFLLSIAWRFDFVGLRKERIPDGGSTEGRGGGLC
jgi:hypothetical protein